MLRSATMTLPCDKMPNNQAMRNRAISDSSVTPIHVSYRIVTIPKFAGDETDNNPPLALAHRFRDFRLLALKTSPGAFASTYEEESQRSLNHTLERLISTKATHFVALAVDDAPDDDAVYEADTSDLLQYDWLGTVVLTKSMSAKADPLGQMAAGGSQVAKAEGHEALHFHLNGMFVQEFARRSGMGRRLIGAALRKAREKSESCGVNGLHCTIIVDEWNDSARSLYARCGFEVTAREVYGDNRIALRMELRETGESAWECGMAVSSWSHLLDDSRNVIEMSDDE
jgi:GNAT superfamily N-acetyltransferase